MLEEAHGALASLEWKPETAGSEVSCDSQASRSAMTHGAKCHTRQLGGGRDSLVINDGLVVW